MNILDYKKTILGYFFLCSLSFILVFICLTPTQFIVKQFLPNFQFSEFKLTQLSGNIWQGSSNVSFKKQPPTQVKWEISPSHLLSNQPVTEISLTNKQSVLQIHSDFQSFTPIFNMHGNLNVAELSTHIHLPSQVTMTGVINIEKLLLINQPPYFFNSLKAFWGGGLISANNNNMRFPPLSITSKQQNNDQIIYITETNSKKSLIEIILNLNKQAEIKMTQRLLTLTKQGKLSDDDDEFVIRFTEKLKI